jgi:hypothetical protein
VKDETAKGDRTPAPERRCASSRRPRSAACSSARGALSATPSAHRAGPERWQSRHRGGAQDPRRLLRRAQVVAPLPASASRRTGSSSGCPTSSRAMTEAEARLEAERCLYCADAPCIEGMPHRDRHPDLHQEDRERQRARRGAAPSSSRTSWARRARGCARSRCCASGLVRLHRRGTASRFAIGRLQRYATETATHRRQSCSPNARPPSPAQRVALVGAGPASLASPPSWRSPATTRSSTRPSGVPGGLNTTGIAPYKLHADEALDEVDWVESRWASRFGSGGSRSARTSSASCSPSTTRCSSAWGSGDDTKLGLPGGGRPRRPSAPRPGSNR